MEDIGSLYKMFDEKSDLMEKGYFSYNLKEKLSIGSQYKIVP